MTSHWSLTSTQVGMFTAQKLANAKNRGIFLSRKPVVKYLLKYNCVCAFYILI